MTTLPLATVRDRLSALVEDVTFTDDALTITRSGVPAAVVISIDDYESIMETLALINEPINQQRLIEAQHGVVIGDISTGEDISRLLAERMRHITGAA